MPVTEDTVTDRMADFLREHGINADTWETAKMPNGTTKTPDLVVEDGGVFYGEAEWKKSEPTGWAQAHDLSQCIGGSGSFLIVYPDELKKKVKQKRLSEDRLEALEGVKYKVAFLREDGTDVDTLSLSEIPSWIEENIHKRKTPRADFDQIIDTLNLTVKRLAKELKESPNLPNLFKNILGPDASGEEMKKVINDAAAYLLINQIAFYRVLSKEREDLPTLDPYDIKSPEELEDHYFDKVLEIDYSPVFAPSVAPQFSGKSVDVLRETVSAVYGLKPERISHDVLGKVFHSLIPFSVRKKVAAYYTKDKAAEILSNLGIENPDATVMDPACGSGTLLVSSYDRKKDLLERDQEFSEEDHHRFMSRDITGIDVMPFAAHLSTINLSLQAPLYETERVRTGIEDSTRLSPGEILSPLSRFVPEEKRQRKLEQFEGGPPKIEGVDTGTIGMDAKPGEPINLHNVDLVIMNPPFTRQQSVANFGKKYKDTLAERFEDKEEIIDKRMKYAYYFLLLADKFLEEGGRIAAVLPVTVLRGYFAEKLRSWLLDNYSLEYIIVRQELNNFSEDTSLREILLIAKKGYEDGNVVSFTQIKNLDEIKPSEIKKARDKTETEKLHQNSNFSLRNTLQENLEEKNLFKEISLTDYELVELWQDISDTSTLTKLGELGVEISHDNEPAQGNGSFESLCLNFFEQNLRRDKWIIEGVGDKSIKAKNRNSKDIVEVEKNSLRSAFRRIVNRGKMDVSDLDEYIVDEKFDTVDKFLSLSDKEEVKWEDWSGYLDRRFSKTCAVTRFRISSSNSKLLSYYSQENRAWSRAGLSSVKGLDEENAKIFTLWFNSAINLLQYLIVRRETEGAWLGVHKYILKDMKTPASTTLKKQHIEQLIELFEKVGAVEFPGIWEQLAMNCKEKDFSKEEIDELKDIFDNITDLMGSEFKPRIKLDKAILDVLGYSEKEKKELISNLYPRLLKEIGTLKK